MDYTRTGMHIHLDSVPRMEVHTIDSTKSVALIIEWESGYLTVYFRNGPNAAKTLEELKRCLNDLKQTLTTEEPATPLTTSP